MGGSRRGVTTPTMGGPGEDVQARSTPRQLLPGQVWGRSMGRSGQPSTGSPPPSGPSSARPLLQVPFLPLLLLLILQVRAVWGSPRLRGPERMHLLGALMGGA